MSKRKEYFLVGHFAKDIIDSNFQIGGTVFYSGILAKKFGFEVKILTSFGEDLKEKIKKEQLLKEIKIFNVASQKSTTFKNIYFKDKDKRRQYLFSVAKKISTKNLPKEIDPQILHLAPLIQEVDPKIAKKFKNSFIGATLQGWLRKRAKNSQVLFSFWKDYKKFLPLFNVAICSLHDLKNDFSLAKEFAKYSKLFVLTNGKKGCIVFENLKITKILPKKILKEGYFTGAGDVFACAFFTNYEKTKNPYLAGEFANEIAGLHIKESAKKLFNFQAKLS